LAWIASPITDPAGRPEGDALELSASRFGRSPLFSHDGLQTNSKDGQTGMNALPTIRRRVVATGLATAALLLGGAGAATAQANSLPTGLFGSAPATQTAPGSGTGGVGTSLLGGKGATGLPGIGLFKALFAIFGAVRTQVPTIAAPIIAQGVTDGTITQAEADQLTALLAGKNPGAGTPTPGSAPAKPSAGELAVLRKVFAAILGQLATIAAPVLAAEVTAGDITQAQADMIAKVLTGLGAAKLPAVPGTTPAIGSAGSPGIGNLLSTLQAKVTSQVKKATKHHKHKKAHTTVRSHRSR
jgi:hypothetical protein